MAPEDTVNSDNPQHIGEVTSFTADSWWMIVVDSVACTVLFVLATAATGIVMDFLCPFGKTRLAIVYLPVWSMFMLSVAFYARYRRRICFSVADIIWAIPVLFAMSAGIDLLGVSSFWVFIIASVSHLAMSYIRSIIRNNNLRQKTDDEPGQLVSR